MVALRLRRQTRNHRLARVAEGACVLQYDNKVGKGDFWFARLRDRHANVRIDIRLRRLTLGNAGDVKPVGDGISELRIDYGPGYRLYFMQRGNEFIVLLAGGDKSTQDRDIREAKALARNL